MSHHFDSPTAIEDGRLNLCDVYAFPSQPGTTALILTLNPDAGRSSPTTFRSEAVYEFVIEGDDAADHDLRLRIGFSDPSDGVQELRVLTATGAVTDLRKGAEVGRGTSGEVHRLDFGRHVGRACGPARPPIRSGLTGSRWLNSCRRRRGPVRTGAVRPAREHFRRSQRQRDRAGTTRRGARERHAVGLGADLPGGTRRPSAGEQDGAADAAPLVLHRARGRDRAAQRRRSRLRCYPLPGPGPAHRVDRGGAGWRRRPAPARRDRRGGLPARRVGLYARRPGTVRTGVRERPGSRRRRFRHRGIAAGRAPPRQLASPVRTIIHVPDTCRPRTPGTCPPCSSCSAFAPRGPTQLLPRPGWSSDGNQARRSFSRAPVAAAALTATAGPGGSTIDM